VIEAKEKVAFGAVFAEWLWPNLQMKRRIWPVLLGLAYIVLLRALGSTYSGELAVGLLPLLDSYNEKTRSFIKYFSPFILTGVVYNSMRFYYWAGIAGHVHVAEPYFFEKALFGILQNGKLVTPNEFFQKFHNAALDLVCGFAYLSFVFEYLAVAFFLFFTGNHKLLRVFGWCFFFVNLLGFVTYLVYPAAPPWYVSQYGLGPALMTVQPSAAAAQRFDLILGTHFFDQIYGRGIDVYGSYPSLHVTYPFLVSFVAFQYKKFRTLAVTFFLLMCLSAVYLQHHYIVDVVLGVIYASITLKVTIWGFSQVTQLESAPYVRGQRAQKFI